jgi:hypothetical protein
MRIWRFALLLSLLISFAETVRAQNSTTSLRGTVTDSTSAAIPGAAVSLANPSIGFQTSTVSDSRGEYHFQELAPGSYVVTITSEGFGQYIIKTILQVAQPVTANARLSIASAGVTIEVKAESSALNTTDATIGNVVDNDTIMQLPSEARNPQTLLALQPGVLYTGQTNSTDSRNGAVSGARPDQTNITLDGLDNNDQIFPSAFTGVLRITLDSTQEFRVTTSDANADTGRSSGGQVNLVTRSGTNTVHGAAYEYNRNSFGVANDWFNKSAQLSSGEANRPGKLIRNTYGVRLGGPLKHDKIFLFGNYEGNRQNESATIVRTVPTASLRAGNLKYINSGSTVTTLTPAQVASMDTQCTANGTCPQGAGDDPASLALFKLYPLPNGSLQGDGYNTASYTFTSPEPVVENVYISRFDFNPSDKHRIYVRGSFQNDQSSLNSYYPGQPPRSKTTDDSKGISASYTWTLSNNKVNNLRYGFVRQSYATRGAGSGNYVTLRSLDLPEASTRSSSSLVPLHNFIDDFTLSKGRHTIQFGANVRHYTYQNHTDANSYNSATANAFWMVNSGFAGTGGTFDPSAFGYPDVSSGFTTNYDFAVSMLAGLVNEETDNFNYNLSTDGKTASLLGLGVPVARSFRSNEFEGYLQDSYKPIPNLTLTLGARYTVQQTPYETNGQQVQPTINIHDSFTTRGQQAALGNTVQPEISFAPSGQARGAKPFYPMSWGNVAPRFAFAYSPAASDGILNKIFGGAGHSSIRGGFGIYFDHFGQGLVANYSRLGSFSLSSSLSNPASVLTADISPRFTGLHSLPGIVPPAGSSITYPQTPSDDPNTTGFAITNGLDDRIKTPYSEAFNLSWQRQISGGFTFEAAYVGRMGRHLLQNLDLAQPLDLVDPKSGMDYYTAGTILSKAVDQGQTTVAAIPYFENLFPDAKTSTQSATQDIYDNLWVFVRGNETAALQALDVYCFPGCGGKTNRFWPAQYSSLYATSSMGSSSYNAGQFILRHPMKNSIQFDISYTFSRSMDLGSDSEANAINTNYTYGFILDAFNPRKNRAVSDFDTTHLVTADWVLKLPVGKGERFGSGSSRLLDALVGGWNISGITRVSSGLPWTIFDGDGWATNWEWESGMVQTAPIKMRKHIDANGSPQIFDDPAKARAALRDPYPGEAGQRNHYRADGYFDVDAGLHKMVHINDRMFFHFAWEVFNVSNSVRFDAHGIDSGSTDGPQLGVYSAQFGIPRRMQLSGRLEF